jgi:thioredoxin-dependent peroxiredoxin
MATTNENITLQGNPVGISGASLKVGDTLPSFKLSGVDLQDIDSSRFQGKPLVISVLPSIDTDVCAAQTKRFNELMSGKSESVSLLTVSRDLPFAFKRWCAAEGVEGLTYGSDHKYRTFGRAFGVDVENAGILARAVFVADKDGKITHLEYVSEISQEPDYELVLSKV